MKRILIVDDNQMLTNLYRGSFTAAGFAVDIDHDGRSGVAAARNAPPDVVLLDMVMPKMNGLEVLIALRGDPALSTVPVIVFSNAYTPDRIEMLWQSGATQVLVKASSTPNIVLEAVRALAARS